MASEIDGQPCGDLATSLATSVANTLMASPNTTPSILTTCYKPNQGLFARLVRAITKRINSRLPQTNRPSFDLTPRQTAEPDHRTDIYRWYLNQIKTKRSRYHISTI